MFGKNFLLLRFVLGGILMVMLSSSSLLFPHSAHAQTTPNLFTYETYFYYDSRVVFSGSSFSANAPVFLYWTAPHVGVAPAGTITANADGAFLFLVTHLPSFPYSTQATLTAIDSHGLSASTTFTETPQVAANPASGSRGDTITVTGGGYGSHEQIEVFFTESPPVLVARTISKEDGTFSASLVLPDTAAPTMGEGIEIKGVTSGIDLFAVFVVTPKVILSPNSGPSGTSVTVNGLLFTPGGNIYIEWVDPATGNETGLQGLVADSNGTFSTSITVPANQTAGHVYYVSVDNAASGIWGIARFTVTS